MRELLLHLLRRALVDRGENVQLQHLLVQRSEELLFESLARDEHLVLARVPRGIQAAVVAAPLPTHERNGSTARAALERAREQMRWMRVDVALALALKALLSLPPREHALDLAPARLRRVPLLVGNDADVRALLDNPFLRRAIHLLHLAGERVLDGGRPIPDEAADVFLVLQNPGHRRYVPAALQADLRGNAFLVQLFRDFRDRLALDEGAVDALNDACFLRNDDELEAIRSQSALLVVLRFALGHAVVAVASAANGEAA
ncbi:MAG: hypothetical protein U0263_03370 [Polyangiaceae bacterium]